MDKIEHYWKKMVACRRREYKKRKNNEAKLDYNFSVNLALVILHIK